MVMRVLERACEQQEIPVETLEYLAVDFTMLACSEKGDLSTIGHWQQ